MSDDVEALVERQTAGERLKFLFFWAATPERGGVGRGCLSQWWEAGFSSEGAEYRTAEHYMMAAKARLFNDPATERKVLAARTPGEAKSLGRQIAEFDEDVWVAHRSAIVVAANVAKFSAHPKLRDYLLSTQGRVLAEASPLDRVWGIGLAADHVDAERPAAWPGLNLLGFALMRARAQLST